MNKIIKTIFAALMMLSLLLVVGCSVKEQVPATNGQLAPAPSTLSSEDQEIDAGLSEVDQIDQQLDEDISFEELDDISLE